jgi:hypothetical protein
MVGMSDGGRGLFFGDDSLAKASRFGCVHLVGDNSENMPPRAGLLNRRRKLLGDQLDDECHARLRSGPTPPHIARVDSGRARSTSY